MSISCLNHFGKLFPDEVGELSEYLSIPEKIFLSRLNRRTQGDIPYIIKRLQSGFKKDVDQILQFTSEYLQAILAESNEECKAREECRVLSRCANLNNTGKTKQKMIGKLFLKIVYSNPKLQNADLTAISKKFPLTYLRSEFDRCLITHAEFQTRTKLSKEDFRSRTPKEVLSEIFLELLKADRMSEAVAIAEVDDTDENGKIDLHFFGLPKLYLVIFELLKKAQTDDALQLLSQIPESASKSYAVKWRLIPALLSADLFSSAIEVAHSVQDSYDKICLYRQIAEAYCKKELPKKALELCAVVTKECSLEILKVIICDHIRKDRLDDAGLFIINLTPDDKEDLYYEFECLVEKLGDKEQYNEAILYVKEISNSYMRTRAIWSLAEKMVKSGQLKEVVIMLQKTYENLGNESLWGDIERKQGIVKDLIESHDFQGAVEIIKLLPSRAYMGYEPGSIIYECYNRNIVGGVVAPIRSLIAQGLFVEAVMLARHIKNDEVRTMLHQEIILKHVKINLIQAASTVSSLFRRWI